MKYFSVFMMACAIACGNFAEAKLSHEQVIFLNNNVIGRDHKTLQDANKAYDGGVEINNKESLDQEIIKSYINMKYSNKYSHNQRGNVLTYKNEDNKVIVLKNGNFIYIPHNNDTVPPSILESHDNVITLSHDVIQGIFVEFIDTDNEVLRNAYIKDLISADDTKRLKAKAYFEDQKGRYTEAYNYAFYLQVSDDWKKNFGKDDIIDKNIDNYKKHTEAQVAVLKYIYDHSEDYSEFKESIKKLLPKDKVYSLYDACKSCREIQWVKDKPDNFMYHVYDGQAFIKGHIVAKDFVSQEMCNDFVTEMQGILSTINNPQNKAIEILVHKQIESKIGTIKEGKDSIKYGVVIEDFDKYKLPNNFNIETDTHNEK